MDGVVAPALPRPGEGITACGAAVTGGGSRTCTQHPGCSPAPLPAAAPPHLNDGLQLLDFGLEHLILSLQLQNLLLLGPILDVVLQFQRLIPLQLAFLLHLVQPMFQLIDLKHAKGPEGRINGQEAPGEGSASPAPTDLPAPLCSCPFPSQWVPGGLNETSSRKTSRHVLVDEDS